MRAIAHGIFVLTCVMAFGSLHAAHSYGLIGTFVLIGLLTFMVTLVHELGHAAAVWRLKGRVEEISVGPVTICPHPFRIAAAPRHEGDIGGFVRYSFDGWETQRKIFLIAAAGPAANLVLTLVAVVMILALPHLPLSLFDILSEPQSTPLPVEANGVKLVHVVRTYSSSDGLLPPAFLASLAVLSAGTCFANLVPFGQSDGRQMLDWYRSRSIR